MMKRVLFTTIAGVLLLTAARTNAFAQLSSAADWATHAANEYQVQANITYLTASGYESKLDVYRRRDVTTPQPTLVFYHGGGWIVGTKEASLMSLMPWFEMGWTVINVEYRMARVALAPAAVEDAQCALRFIVNQQNNAIFNHWTILVIYSLPDTLCPNPAGWHQSQQPLAKI